VRFGELIGSGKLHACSQGKIRDESSKELLSARTQQVDHQPIVGA
jgi:hypothetical protein